MPNAIAIDPRNRDILISISGTLYPRNKAVVLVFDSGFIPGGRKGQCLRDLEFRTWNRSPRLRDRLRSRIDSRCLCGLGHKLPGQAASAATDIEYANPAQRGCHGSDDGKRRVDRVHGLHASNWWQSRQPAFNTFALYCDYDTNVVRREIRQP